jgi:acyl-CoA synthetase (AMP-forming)/AMP-acid ligase II
LIGLLDYQTEKCPNDVCLLYPDLCSDTLQYGSATFAQFSAASHRLAVQYRNYIDIPTCEDKPIIVALLGNSSADYLVTIYALLRLGVVVFPLSTRNSKAALENLMQTTATTYLIVGPGQIDVELDGLTKIYLETVNWTANDIVSILPTTTIANNSLEHVVMMFHR